MRIKIFTIIMVALFGMAATNITYAGSAAADIKAGCEKQAKKKKFKTKKERAAFIKECTKGKGKK